MILESRTTDAIQKYGIEKVNAIIQRDNALCCVKVDTKRNLSNFYIIDIQAHRGLNQSVLFPQVNIIEIGTFLFTLL